MSNKENSLAKIVSLVNSRGKIPALQLVRDKPLAAMLSKAIDPTIPITHTPAGSRKIEAPSAGMLHNIASRTANNISHASTIMQLLPDLQLGAQILVSSVASPKDQMTLELAYKTTVGILPPTVMSAAIEIVKEHFDKHYAFKNKIPRILQEVLFDNGSHILAILPENSIDEMINRNNAVSMESFQESLGIDSLAPLTAQQAITKGIDFLGAGLAGYTNQKPRPNKGLAGMTFSIGNESIDDVYSAYTGKQSDFSQQIHINLGDNKFTPVDGLYITDNPNILRMPGIEAKLRKDQITAKLKTNKITAGLESLSANSKVKLDDFSLKNLLYKPRKRGMHPMQVMKTDNQLARRSVGRPLWMELPSESVIPICAPGREDQHVGYLVLLDENGNPVKAMQDRDSFMEMSQRLNNVGSQTNSITNRLKQLTDGMNCSQVEYTGQMARIYTDLVEQDLLARFRNGIFTNTVQLVKNQDFYNVMLARNMQQQQTTILFLPLDMVTYFARKYNQYGIGVSILDEMKMLNNMRAIAMMANTILGIKNSIPRTNVDLTIDETDPDPMKTAEMFLQELTRVNQTAVPFGASAPVDIADYLQRAQYQVNLNGHPGIPDTKVAYSESNTGYSKVDTELEESFERRSAMAMGLQQDTINNGFNQETATSVVASNLMLSRRVMIIQDQINPHITDCHRKTAKADEDLLEKLRELLFSEYDSLNMDEAEIAKAIGQENADVKPFVVQYLINDFIEGLEVTLPRPNTATAENQKAALMTYSELLDITLDAMISSEFFSDEIGGELSRSVDSIKKIIRAHFIRQFMAENGIMPELAALATLTADNEAEVDIWKNQEEHVKKLMITVSGFMKKIHKTKMDSNEVVNRLNEIQEEAGAAGTGGSSDTSSSDDSSSDDTSDPFAMNFDESPELLEGGLGDSTTEPEPPKVDDAPEEEEPIQ